MWFNMTIEIDQIIELVSTVARDEQLKVTVTQVLRGAAAAAAGTVVGGLIAGPLGLAAGAACGGVAAAATCQDFKSVVEIIATMKPEKKEHLAGLMNNIMRSIDITDVAMFASMVAGNMTVRTRVVKELVSFLQQEMKMTVANY